MEENTKIPLNTRMERLRRLSYFLLKLFRYVCGLVIYFALNQKVQYRRMFSFYLRQHTRKQTKKKIQLTSKHKKVLLLRREI